jgi:hypothetical protein
MSSEEGQHVHALEASKSSTKDNGRWTPAVSCMSSPRRRQGRQKSAREPSFASGRPNNLLRGARRARRSLCTEPGRAAIARIAGVNEDMFAEIFIGVVITGFFAFDMGRRWWVQNEWRRRVRQSPRFE